MRKRRMRRIMGVFLLAGMLAGVGAGCAGEQKLSDQFDEAEVKSQAEEVIRLLNDGEVDTLVDDEWNTMLKSALDKDAVRTQVLPIIEELGAFESFDKEAVTGGKDPDTEQEYAVAVVKAQYEKRKAQFTISFDEDMKVGGFYIK
jgi:hypothetical protein